MRIRSFFVLFGLLACVGDVSASSVLIEQYDAIIENAPWSARCVVPQAITDAKAPRFICIYNVPGHPKLRDYRQGIKDVPGGADPDFNVWLTQHLTPPEQCDLGSLFKPGWPAEAELKESCPKASVTVQDIPATNRDEFFRAVRNAARTTVPTPAVETSTPSSTVKTPAAEPTPVHVQTRTLPASATMTPEAPQTIPALPPVPKPASSPAVPATRQQFDDFASRIEKKLDEKEQASSGVVLLSLVVMTLCALLFVAERTWHYTSGKQPASGDDHPPTEQPNAAQAALDAIDGQVGIHPDQDRIARISALIELESAVGQVSGDKVPYVRGCGALMKFFSGSAFWEGVKDPGEARRKVADFTEEVHRLYVDLGYPGPSKKSANEELKSIREKLVALQAELEDKKQRIVEADKIHEQVAARAVANETPLLTIRRCFENVDAAKRFIAMQWPDAVAGELVETVPVLKARMEQARGTASTAGCERSASVDKIVQQLVHLLEGERNASQSVNETLVLLREYLALPDIDPQKVRALIASEQRNPQRILRLVLAAALPELRRAIDKHAPDEVDVIHMLNLGDVAGQLEGFLGMLGNYGEVDSLVRGIRSAFQHTWLQNLFRAEAVLRAYFMGSTFAEIGDLLTVVAWALRHAIAASGFEIDRVQLLERPPVAMDPKYDSGKKFRTSPLIRDRVNRALKGERDGGFVVDIDSVGIRTAGEVLNRGAVVLANRIDWED
jgi:hypothetical protein